MEHLMLQKILRRIGKYKISSIKSQITIEHILILTLHMKTCLYLANSLLIYIMQQYNTCKDHIHRTEALAYDD